MAWRPLVWEPVVFSEIEKFPCAVLAHHYPDVPNVGDVTKTDWSKYRNAADIVVAGAPCQDYSVAGQRAGMDGKRGSLTIRFLDAVSDIRPRWLVFENVPGLLSSNQGRDFERFLDELAQRGYFGCWRCLDAQYFGLAQRRKRVFFVGYLGNWRPAAAILFERESLRWDSPPCREAGQDAAGTLAASVGGCNENDAQSGRLIAGPASVTSSMNPSPVSPALDVGKYDGFAVATNRTVRRLTPREAERLQGFPDDYTAITYRGKPAADGPRYKALGNSFAVPVVRWVGKRIAMVEKILQDARD